ncbi:MAG: HlyD family efflux transporter periplasmic adaptor subunit [Sedimentisphaerales bacterium]|nr:HlyD family efflux transporter periplasmic adaptor subunit [Sedimentisphaerales bacterium]
MKASNNNKANRSKVKLITIAVVIVATGVVGFWYRAVKAEQAMAMKVPTFAAKKGPLTISVLENGTIKARQQEIIYNQVEGRTSIVWIIPEGTRVNKGDLLVELDSSTLQDQKIDQEIRVQNAEASYISARENLEVVRNQALSDINEAMLNMEFAQQDLKKYEEGDYPIALASAQQEIALAQEELERANYTLEWSQRLFAEKYISQTELQADQLAASRAKVKLEVAQNNLKLLQEYTYKRQIAQLTSNVFQARMALDRIQRKTRADVAQAEATLRAREQEYNREKDKLAKILDQLAKTKIYAPVDGMVVYATSAQSGGRRMMDNRQPLQEGVEVFERQELIYLPTANLYKAEVAIHEANLQKVRVGLPARVTVDALMGKVFFGTVARIAPLPDPQSMWMNPDLKVYNTDVFIEGEDPELRTGLSCKVEIIVAQYDETIYVPVQAVVRVDGKPTVYVLNKDGTQTPNEVQIGLDNGSMVSILSGLQEGELVVLTPPLQAAQAELSWYQKAPGDANQQGSDVSQLIRERLQGNDNLNGFNGQGIGPGGQTGQPMGRFRRPMMDQNAPGPFMEGPTEAQRQQFRQRLEQLSPEERENLRRRFMEGGGGGPGRAGRRSRQDEGQPGGNP